MERFKPGVRFGKFEIPVQRAPREPTNISHIEMVDRKCLGCQVVSRVARTSKSKFHSKHCLEEYIGWETVNRNKNKSKFHSTMAEL